MAHTDVVAPRYAVRYVYSRERAAGLAGISHVTLRAWAKTGEPAAAMPVLFLNEVQPLYTAEQVEQLREFVKQRHARRRLTMMSATACQNK